MIIQQTICRGCVVNFRGRRSSMGKKKDSRSVQTEALLVNSLARLLSEKELNRISVRELTDSAGIHRATFYDHYTDIFDLYDRMMDSFFRELERTMEDDSIVTYSDFYGSVIDFLSANINLGRLAFSTPRIISKVEAFFINSCIATWNDELDICEITPEIRFAASYRVNGCMGILKAWINGDVEYSAPRLKDYISGVDEKTDHTLTSIFR